MLVGVASPAEGDPASLGAPVDVGSPAGADAVADAAPVDSAVAAGLAVSKPGAAVVTEAADVEVATKVADAAAGAMVVVWETERMVLTPSPPVPGIAGTLGMGIVMDMAVGVTPVFAALVPTAAAAAAASAGVSWTVVLVTTRVVSFMEVAGSRFS